MLLFMEAFMLLACGGGIATGLVAHNYVAATWAFNCALWVVVAHLRRVRR